MWKAASISGLALCALAAMLLQMTPATSEAMRIEQVQTCEAKSQRPGCNNRCGNGVVDAGLGETCEPPNTATCDATCMNRAPLCGDTFITPPETCDDGNAFNGDGCQADCTIATACPCFTVPQIDDWLAAAVQCRTTNSPNGRINCVDIEIVGARRTGFSYGPRDPVGPSTCVSVMEASLSGGTSPAIECEYEDPASGASLLSSGPGSVEEAIACRDLLRAKQMESGVCDSGP